MRHPEKLARAYRSGAPCALLIVLVGTGCGGSSTSQGDAGGGADASTAAEAGDAAASACVLPAPIDTPVSTACPAGCGRVEAVQIDVSRMCKRRVHLGCMECPVLCGGAPEGPCLRSTVDGRIVYAPTYAMIGRSGWIGCTPEEEALFRSSVPCEP